MERTECPQNWTDQSEFEDGTWEYKFEKQISNATLRIQQIQWRGQTDWTVQIKKDGVLVASKIGNTDTIEQAIKMAEAASAPVNLEWDGMSAKSGDVVFDIVGKKNGKFFVKVWKFRVSQKLPFAEFETVEKAKAHCASLKI